MSTEALQEDDSKWFVECSDEETYNICKTIPTVWEPHPSDIVELYNAINKGESLSLEWVCHDRRSPDILYSESEKDEESNHSTVEMKEEKKKVTEFDFDEFGPDAPPAAITPKRITGTTKTPRSQQKRVANMEKIMNDLIRHKEMEANDKNTSEKPQKCNI